MVVHLQDASGALAHVSPVVLSRALELAAATLIPMPDPSTPTITATVHGVEWEPRARGRWEPRAMNQGETTERHLTGPAATVSTGATLASEAGAGSAHRQRTAMLSVAEVDVNVTVSAVSGTDQEGCGLAGQAACATIWCVRGVRVRDACVVCVRGMRAMQCVVGAGCGAPMCLQRLQTVLSVVVEPQVRHRARGQCPAQQRHGGGGGG